MRTHLLLLHMACVTSLFSAGPADATLSQPYYDADTVNSPFPIQAPTSLTMPISNGLSTMKVIRPMRVTVTPAHPEPFEEVSVTISGKTSDPHLTLGTVTVDRQGADITIDLDWLTFRPLGWSGSVCQAMGSAGYGIEQVNPIRYNSLADKPYEVIQSLGSFEEGTYWIHVYSHGALEGEAWTTFRVRDPMSMFSDLLDTDWPW